MAQISPLQLCVCGLCNSRNTKLDEGEKKKSLRVCGNDWKSISELWTQKKRKAARQRVCAATTVTARMEKRTGKLLNCPQARTLFKVWQISQPCSAPHPLQTCVCNWAEQPLPQVTISPVQRKHSWAVRLAKPKRPRMSRFSKPNLNFHSGPIKTKVCKLAALSCNRSEQRVSILLGAEVRAETHIPPVIEGWVINVQSTARSGAGCAVMWTLTEQSSSDNQETGNPLIAQACSCRVRGSKHAQKVRKSGKRK